MNVIHWLLDTQARGNDLQNHLRAALVTKADDQTCRSWEVINESRAERGEAPITPAHPFRPRELIDPCEGVDHG